VGKHTLGVVLFIGGSLYVQYVSPHVAGVKSDWVGYSILRSWKPIPTRFAEAIAKEPPVCVWTKVVEVLDIIPRSLRLGRDQVGDSLRERRKMRY
jgi:hypothetical protein